MISPLRWTKPKSVCKCPGLTKHMELTTNLKGCLQFKQNGLAEEDLPGFEAETTDLILCQLNIFSRSGAFHFERKVSQE